MAGPLGEFWYLLWRWLAQRKAFKWKVRAIPWHSGCRVSRSPGLTFYTGDEFPRWQGDLFVGGMQEGQIPGTGQLHRIKFNENMEEIRRESLLSDLRQRIRDVKTGA